MRIVNFSEEFNPEIEEELLKSVKFIIDTDRAFLGDFLQQRQYLAKNRMKTVLVASREKTAKGNQSHIACEIIFVQYFAGYGFYSWAIQRTRRVESYQTAVSKRGHFSGK